MLGRELGRKAVATQAHARNVVARLRPVAGRRQVAFQGARPLVRVFAAEPAAGEAAPKAAPKAAPSMTLEEVKEGGEYEGTVEAVEDFGAFVNFGTTTNGLIHISKLSAGFTKNAKDVVSPGQKVTVTVLSVDAEKKRVSLSLKQAPGADAGSSAPARADKSDGDTTYSLDNPDEGEVVEEDVEVELDDGQFEVRSDLPGFESIPFVMEEDDDELTDASITAMEANMDDIEIQYDLDVPAYMEEVAGKVTRVEDYGVFLEFAWKGKTLTGLLTKEEMKVPSSLLDEDKQAALREEWEETEFEMPQFVELGDDELDVRRYYQPGDEVPAFVLESALVDAKGISLTHFTDEDVAAEAVEAYEGLDEDEDEELDKLLGAAALEDEVLAVDPESLLEDEEEDAGLAAEGISADFEGPTLGGQEDSAGAYDLNVTPSGLIRGKNGFQMAPMGLPSRPVESLNSMGLAALGTNEVDFDGDEVALFEYWSADAYDNIPKDILKRMGLKMSFNDQGEAEFADREGYEEVDLPIYTLGDGDIDERAKAFVEDLMGSDEDEAELPARAARRPAVLAAAVQS